MEKTGYISLSNGFYNDDVAHWHGTYYFEYIYDTSILTSNGYDIYDLIEYIGEKYNFKPLVIESFREPVSQSLSYFFHKINLRTNKYLSFYMKKLKKNK